MRLPELHAEDQLTREIKEQGLKYGWEENADGVLHHQGQPYVLEII